MRAPDGPALLKKETDVRDAVKALARDIMPYVDLGLEHNRHARSVTLRDDSVAAPSGATETVPSEERETASKLMTPLWSAMPAREAIEGCSVGVSSFALRTPEACPVCAGMMTLISNSRIYVPLNSPVPNDAYSWQTWLDGNVLWYVLLCQHT